VIASVDQAQVADELMVPIDECGAR
jgi:hypothetical protein